MIRFKLKRHIGLLGAAAVMGVSMNSAHAFLVLDPFNLVPNSVSAGANVVSAGANTVSAVMNTISAPANVVTAGASTTTALLTTINTGMNALELWNSYQIVKNTGEMRKKIDTLSNRGDINVYLANFKDISTYNKDNCLSVKGCAKSGLNAITARKQLASNTQKQANDALMRGVAEQQDAMETDADRLDQLRNSVNDVKNNVAKTRGAMGTNTMLQYLTQFNANQADQMIKMRAMMTAQSNAVAARQQAVADRESLEAASSQQLRTGDFIKTSASPTLASRW